MLIQNGGVKCNIEAFVNGSKTPEKKHWKNEKKSAKEDY